MKIGFRIEGGSFRVNMWGSLICLGVLVLFVDLGEICLILCRYVRSWFCLLVWNEINCNLWEKIFLSGLWPLNSADLMISLDITWILPECQKYRTKKKKKNLQAEMMVESWSSFFFYFCSEV